MKDHQTHVFGEMLDNETRCKHYDSELDRIAIKFHCCQSYYACFYCHQEEANHKASRWEKNHFTEKAIRCGSCRTELTIQAYLKNNAQCPNCHAAFNPRCERHHHLYFAISD